MKRCRIAVAVFAGLVALAGALAGCSALDDPTQSTSAKLVRQSDDSTLFGPDSGTIHIPYCFVTDPAATTCQQNTGTATPATISAAELAVYSNAIEHSWANGERIKFDYKGMCNRVSDSSPKIVVWVFGSNDPQNQGYGGQTGVAADDAGNCRSPCLGTATLTAPNSVDCPEHASVRFYSNGSMNAGVDRLNYLAIHEFGHALGWEHEQENDGGLADPNPNYCYNGYFDGGVFVPTPTPTYDDTPLTAYDPDSVMGYCRTARADDGRLSDFDIAGMQAAYGAVNQMTTDSDGDGYNDYRDDCPYVSDGQQSDSNFEAELRTQILAGYSSDDGHRPTVSDTTDYINRWHVAYAGDACDPVATDRAASVGQVNSNVRTASQCWDVTVGGTGYHKYLVPASGGSFPIRYNSLMQFNPVAAGPAGFQGKRTGKTAPSFCECQYATDADASVRAKCQNHSLSLFCDVGDDSQFPALDNSFVPGSFDSIHTEAFSLYNWHEFFYGQFSALHVNPQPGYSATQLNQLWANAADLATFGFSGFPTGGLVTNTDHPIGLFWSQVQTFDYDNLINLHESTTGITPMPKNDAGAPHVANLQNVYVGTDASWDYGVCHFTVVAPFSYRWMRVPYCDPTPVPASYGMIPHMVATPGNIIMGTDVSGSPTEISSSFTSSALAALSNVASGSWEEIAADDRVSGAARDDTGPNAILVDTGKTRIRGAFTKTGALIDEQQPATPVGEQSTTTLRSYAAGANELYSLEFVGSNWQIAARNVSDALAGVSTVSTINLGAAFASPTAIAYNRATKLVYAIDSVLAGRSHYFKLVTVDPTSGALTTLWQSAVYSGTVPTTMLSTTTDGELLLGFTGKGDGLYHVLHMNSGGRPWHSTSGSGSLYSAVVGHSGAITIPLVQTVTTTQLNASFSQVGWDSLSQGACGSTWLQTTFARDVAGVTGALGDGILCQAINDGGFESGTFNSWQATGQSETISTNAHSGTYSAKLGTTTPTNGDSTVRQSFVVPARGGTLSFWYSNVCPDSVAYDWFTATLLDTSGNVLATIVPKTCAASSSWSQGTLNLASWQGQTVSVVLTSHDDNYPGDATYSFVDDVVVQ